jgi:PIN domain nuclease of toxin-antitoxin system
MRLLIDTHTFIWWMEASSSLSAAARAAVADPANQILISVASVWELVIKVSSGRLNFPADPETIIRAEGFELLAISFAHLRQNGALPFLHKDPFDRMLVAQAMVEAAPLVTRDRQLSRYGVPTLW